MTVEGRVRLFVLVEDGGFVGWGESPDARSIQIKSVYSSAVVIRVERFAFTVGEGSEAFQWKNRN